MLDLDVCSCSGRTLTRLVRPAVMATVARGSIHGYLIAQRLEQMPMFAEHPPDHAGIYRMLKAMDEEGLLLSAWDLEDSGPARRRYELTADGKRCLRRWQQTIQDYHRALQELLGEVRQSVGRMAGSDGRAAK